MTEITQSSPAVQEGSRRCGERGACLSERHRLRPGAGRRDGASRFRAWISRGSGRGRTTLQEIRLRPVTGRQVVVRTEACNLCYSNVGAVLGIQAAPPAARPGHTRQRRTAPASTRTTWRSSRVMAAWASSRPSVRKCGGCKSAIVSVSRARRSAAPATTACAGAQTCANCSAETSLAISRRSPNCATARRSIRTRTSAGWPS